MAPSPDTTVYGVPPTEAKERTGESTPPGITRRARSNHSALVLDAGGTGSGPASATERLGHLSGEVGQDEIGPGPLEDGQLLERDGLPVDEARRGRRLDHRELAAHVVGGQGNR